MARPASAAAALIFCTTGATCFGVWMPASHPVPRSAVRMTAASLLPPIQSGRGSCTGLGLNPQAIKGVLGVFKAYSTRVGGGPMPSEMDEPTAERIREIAQEYGTTTGRARRIGWFDGVAARYSQLVNGFTGLVLTRLDILDGFESVKLCVGYRADGEDVSRFPANTSLLARCEPVYEELPGWDRPTASATSMCQLPANAVAYIRRIEELVGCQAQIVSTGPSRAETIQRSPVFE